MNGRRKLRMMKKMKGRKSKRRAKMLVILILLLGSYLGVNFFKQGILYVSSQLREVTGPSSKLVKPRLDAPTIEGHSAILMDASSGRTLMMQDADIAFPVASMSKMMTEYIVQEQVEKGTIHWDDQVEISKTANNIDPGGAKIYINENDVLTVRDLYSAMAVSSANNAAKALAEHIAGTEKKFAKIMNDKARKMSLSDRTNFVNATGLSNPDGSDNLMTAEDVAHLAYRLLHDFPEVVETTNLPQYELAFDGTILRNSNAMLYPENQDLYYELVDGLKTGFTESAGYCFTGTAKKGDKRLISVVMGAESDQARFLETYKLLSYGFNNF
jgi:D-alanyl-D-alanine carboxypeptidase